MMTPEMRTALRNTLVRDEGWENYPYVDTVGKVTIGCGRNLTDRGISNETISAWLTEDIDYFYKQLTENFWWFKELNEARQIALVNMCFMGFKKFCGFKKMLAALERADYAKAADEMLESKWATQVKDRAVRLSEIMYKGEL